MYEAHFGLADLPFQIAPDPRFYVDATPHRAALDALLSGLARGDEFMLLTGDFGSGKTTVARRLVELVDKDEYAIGELSGLRTEGDDLLNRVAESLGVRDFDAEHRLGALIGQLEDFGHDGRQALLVVDEAHGVGLDALRRLKKLTAVQVDGHGVLHVCFLGRSAPPGIEDLRRLGRPLAIGTSIHLEALDAAGTRAYILHRLKLVGWSGSPAFHRDVTDEIHHLCEGNPGRVNRLCAHILLQLYMNGRDDTSPEVVRAVDKLMKSELEGEGLPIDLPPPAAAGREPDTVVEPRSFVMVDDDDRIEIEGLPTHSHQTLPAVRSILPIPTTQPWTGVPVGSRTGHRIMQGVLAILLMVGGGVIWQAIGGRATRSPDVAQTAKVVLPITPAPAPSAAVVGLAAMAEQAIADQPPAAGHPTAAASPPETARAAPPVDATAPTRRLAEAVRDVPAVDRGHRRARVRPAEGDARAPADPVPDPAPEAVRPRPAAEAPPVAPAVCNAAAETMGLCTRSAVREETRASAREAPQAQPQPQPQPQPRVQATAPAQLAPQAAAAQPAPQAAPPPAPAPRPRPACDPTRTALGLCPD